MPFVQIRVQVLPTLNLEEMSFTSDGGKVSIVHISDLGVPAVVPPDLWVFAFIVRAMVPGAFLHKVPQSLFHLLKLSSRDAMSLG